MSFSFYSFMSGRNVALKQVTSQSSWPWNSKLAVDGNRDGNYESSSCTHSDQAKTNPTWEIRLASPHAINRFVLFNRMGKYETNHHLKGYGSEK